MQEGASQKRSQQQGKPSPVVLGIGAAVVASAVTLVIMMSNPSPVATPDQAVSSSTKVCQLMQRRLLVSTTQGSGTVRFRASGWLSPPFTLSTQPQVVIFPLLRPDTTPVEEVISVEGNATDVVVTSEVTDLHRVFDVAGPYTLTLTWAPRKSC